MNELRAEELHEKILTQTDMSKEIEDETLVEIIHKVLAEEEEENEYSSLKEKVHIGKELFNAFRKLNILQELIEDDEITEIMINGVQNIFIEKEGRITKLDKRFISRQKLEDVIQQIVAGANRLVNEASPIVDARLEDGSRVNVVLYPIALNGPIVTIRKFPKEAITMEKLVKWKSIDREVCDFLKELIVAKYNIFISGGTGSGKTTFLNALSQYIPKEERIITIEDNAELQIMEIANLVRLEARNANIGGVGEISIRDLIKTALRMRPTRIIVGEIRGTEAIDLLQAMNTGHQGNLSTGHSNSAEDMLSRLETMVYMGMDLPLPAIRRQIASGLDVIVHLGRLRDSSRKVLEVMEILGYENEEIQTQKVFEFQEIGEENGKIIGEMRKVNELTHKEKLLAAGL